MTICAPLGRTFASAWSFACGGSLANATRGLSLGCSPSSCGSCASAARLACTSSTRAYSTGTSPGVPGPADDGERSSEAPGASEDTQNKQRPALTHVDRSGRASMVDVGDKGDTQRIATASGRVLLGREAFALVRDNMMAKGDVLPTAELAGIMGAKQTSALIPLCHSIVLSRVGVRLVLEPESASVRIHSEARTTGKTGVEMEALTAVSVAALTVYDMCKAVSTDICISDVRLDSKQGGRRTFERAGAAR